MDFTLKKYHTLLYQLQVAGYDFITFSEYCGGKGLGKYVILRHDVDLLPYNSLIFAKIQNELGIKGSYYFRAVSQSWNETVIKEIIAFGHEVGYHYENLTTCRGNMEDGIADFEKNLNALRQFTEVKTICMHGSPLSSYDSKDLWNTYRYQDYGLIGEPYFDVDFDNVFYLTDTGRRWDGRKVSVRDKVTQQEQWIKKGLVFNSTQDIINAIEHDILPDKIMMTFHPQRWHSSFFRWFKELILQNIKNSIKYFLIKR